MKENNRTRKKLWYRKTKKTKLNLNPPAAKFKLQLPFYSLVSFFFFSKSFIFLVKFTYPGGRVRTYSYSTLGNNFTRNFTQIKH